MKHHFQWDFSINEEKIEIQGDPKKILYLNLMKI